VVNEADEEEIPDADEACFNKFLEDQRELDKQ